jgi:hypothetical protein
LFVIKNGLFVTINYLNKPVIEADIIPKIKLDIDSLSRNTSSLSFVFLPAIIKDSKYFALRESIARVEKRQTMKLIIDTAKIHKRVNDLISTVLTSVINRPIAPADTINKLLSYSSLVLNHALAFAA